ncbi:hypothetical protein BGZ96_003716 [Linnemannia gamsii]|uniref:DUF659 domain-containing protein n=1 Tax=Linnemannia gamsii TaxID=64522 RepID=A0ABQ7JIY9_9FUNG|nr:hypothetical protein BGZ96_003716 [Linnemannia gamsii]
MSRMVLGMEEIHEAKQTWDVLLKYLNKVLAFWNLEDKVVAATTDQGSNIKKCMSVFKESGTTWMPCASHCIQLHINKYEDQLLMAWEG